MEQLPKNDILDLNQIFHLNISYNFDLLKTVLDGILKTQKANQEELNNMKADNIDKNEKIAKLMDEIALLKEGFKQGGGVIPVHSPVKDRESQKEEKVVNISDAQAASGQINESVGRIKAEGSVVEPSPSNKTGSLSIKKERSTINYTQLNTITSEKIDPSPAYDEITNKIIVRNLL